MSHMHHDSGKHISGNAEAIPDVERFRVLLEHWIEHNAVHGAEFEKWSRRAQDANLDEVAVSIDAAAESIRVVNDRLRDALVHLTIGVKENSDVPK